MHGKKGRRWETASEWRARLGVDGWMLRAYQTFLYAYAYGQQQHKGLPGAIILYPTPDRAVPLQRLHVRRADGQPSAEISGLGLHLPSALDDATAGRVGDAGVALLARVAHRLDLEKLAGLGR